MTRNRFRIMAGLVVLGLSFAASPDTALAFSADPLDRALAVTRPIEHVQSRIGYWRKRQEQADMRRYRGRPGAQRVLRQQRKNLCRNVPEMC